MEGGGSMRRKTVNEDGCEAIKVQYAKILALTKASDFVDEKVKDQIKCDLARTNTTDRVKTKRG
jgi:hypothetical protein